MDCGNQWFDLFPKDLLVIIFQRFDRIDVLRLRGVCKSWRSFTLDFLKNEDLLLSPLKLPVLVPPNLKKAEPLRSPPRIRLFTPYGPSSRRYITVTESTVYRLEPSQDLENPNASMVVGEGSSSSSKGILVEVKAEGPNVVRLLPPFSKLRNHWYRKFLKNLNLLELRFSEICKIYESERFFFSHIIPKKLAVLSWNPPRATTDGYVVMAIFDPRRLYFLKSGDEEWIAIDEQNSDYKDLISYKGKFYAVTSNGSAIVIDSFSQVSEIAYSIRDAGDGGDSDHRMQLVESLSDLLLVDGHTLWTNFEVYKLDEEERRWVRMRSLGDRVLLVDRNRSFSVSSRDFAGCEGNCFCYLGYSRCAYASVFYLEDCNYQNLDLVPPLQEVLSWALVPVMGKKKKKKIEESKKRKKQRRGKEKRREWR
ncbi:hypothetical protein L1049_023960 [Liquidambar formosana]|uniref:F-box domain-containing protein n=1 Tax=Liquidambar formosana TaxID=63359 RepID=A0AAP0X422_LIQFO